MEGHFKERRATLPTTVRRGICRECKKGPRKLSYRADTCALCYRRKKAAEMFGHCGRCRKILNRFARPDPEKKTERSLCIDCYEKLTGTRDLIGTCPKCSRPNVRLVVRHPKTREQICHRCSIQSGGFIGKCSRCGNKPRQLYGKVLVCLTCYRKFLGIKVVNKHGICPVCKQGPRLICYRHRKTREHVCKKCFNESKKP